MRRAFSTKGGDPTRPWLIDELLDEDPRWEAWLDLPFDQVKALFQEATRPYEDEKIPFKSTFKKLLNRATAKDRVVIGKKIEKTQHEIDEENHRLWLEAQQRDREYAERKKQATPPGGGRGPSRPGAAHETAAFTLSGRERR